LALFRHLDSEFNLQNRQLLLVQYSHLILLITTSCMENGEVSWLVVLKKNRKLISYLNCCNKNSNNNQGIKEMSIHLFKQYQIIHYQVVKNNQRRISSIVNYSKDKLICLHQRRCQFRHLWSYIHILTNRKRFS